MSHNDVLRVVHLLIFSMRRGVQSDFCSQKCPLDFQICKSSYHLQAFSNKSFNVLQSEAESLKRALSLFALRRAVILPVPVNNEPKAALSS